MPSTKPLALRLADLPPEERRRIISRLSFEDALAALYDWEGTWARPDQREPKGEWRTWLLRSGRGAGKTRAGAEWVRGKVERNIYGRIALVAPTAADCRDVIVEGESGILATARHDFRPVYVSSKRRIEWPNGARAFLYSGEEPDRLRGPQHDAAWCDELASWRHPETWDMLLLGLRIGRDPRAIVTTTPRPTRLVRKIAESPTTVTTVASTYSNIAFLAHQFIDDVVSTYDGTHLGRQEIYGEIIEDILGALWTRNMLDAQRLGADDVERVKASLTRIAVAVDPAVTSGETSDETGIVVVGCDDATPPHGYVLEDLSGRYSPDKWARLAVEAYHRWDADRIVAEVNNGGDLVEHTVRTVDPDVSYRKVIASRGKWVRAEPVAALYEQGRVHHVGLFGPLEDQMCNFTPDLDRKAFGSPDRVDALVWGMTFLLIGKRGRKIAESRTG
jgi:phage terminase large subunit-like protein